jgi:hypothetical protein
MRPEVILGSVMIALLWLVCAAMAVLLVIFWPTVQTAEDASSTVLVFLIVAGVGTWFLAHIYL